MNLPEGLRRIGIIAGLIGASWVVFHGYREFIGKPWEDRRQVARFDALMKRPDIKNLADEAAQHRIDDGPVNLNNDPEISRVFITSSKIQFIVTTDQTYLPNGPHRSLPETFWVLPIFVLLSTLGFLVPWGIFKVLIWVVSGFLKAAP